MSRLEVISTELVRLNNTNNKDNVPYQCQIFPTNL